MANIVLSGNRILQGRKEYRKYIRNPEYLDLPTLSNGDEKIYLLAKIYEVNNYFRFKVTGNYQIDWGDGQAVQTYTSNAYADYEIDWANISASTVTSDGFRQAIITITPQSGANMSFFQMGSIRHPSDVGKAQKNIVDCKMAGQNFTTMSMSFKDNYGLEQFEFVGTCNVTNFSQAFMQCYSLQKIVGINTSNVTTFYRMFYSANVLLEVPKFDMSSATSIEQMFYNCYDIEYIEPYSLDSDAPSITSLFNTFGNCQRLLTCPITSCTNITNFSNAFLNNKWGGDFNLNCSNATVVTNMFEDCINLISCNATFPNNLTDTSYMFDNCHSLEEVKLFDCSNVTNSGFMFRNTYRIKDLSAWDFRSATNMQYMFINSKLEKSPAHLGGGWMLYFAQSCIRVKKWGQFHQPMSAGTVTRAFLSNYSITEFPSVMISTSITAISSAMSNMRSITVVPAWDVSNITNAGDWFKFCSRLEEVNVTGMTVGHSYRECNLTRTAIVNIFNNLGTANGTQTIEVTFNPGSADLTAADELIATNKGWTVTS